MKLEIDIPDDHIEYLRNLLKQHVPGAEKISNEEIANIFIRSGMMGWLAVSHMGAPFNSLFLNKPLYDEAVSRVLCGSIEIESDFDWNAEKAKKMPDGTVQALSVGGGGVRVKTTKPKG